MTAVFEYELAVLNIFIFNMLVFQYVWKYIISVIGTSRLSLSGTRGLKSPNSYEISYDKYRESLSCPHPPMHDNIVYRRSHRLAIWRYEKWPYRPTLESALHTQRESIEHKHINAINTNKECVILKVTVHPNLKTNLLTLVSF